MLTKTSKLKNYRTRKMSLIYNKNILTTIQKIVKLTYITILDKNNHISMEDNHITEQNEKQDNSSSRIKVSVQKDDTIHKEDPFEGETHHQRFEENDKFSNQFEKQEESNMSIIRI